jgi:Tfp pilus assembly protein PilF
MADLDAAAAKPKARQRRRPLREPETPEAVEIAMREERGSDHARIVLEKQARLIDAQVVLARADFRHRGWQIIGERVGAALKGLTALAGVVLLLGVGAFVWSAAKADGMVIEAFAVPPDMERRGFSGAAVAAQLLDRINAIETSTESARAASSYDKSWGEDSGIEVPYAGVSIGQLRRELRGWLGSETRLTGEVVRMEDGRIAISFRTGPQASGRAEGSEAAFDALLQDAALGVFRTTQPYRYAIWLSRNDPQSPQIAQIFEQLARSHDVRERLWGMHGLALYAASEAQTVAIYKRALQIRPDFLPAIGNMPFYARNAGREEEALRLFQRSAKAFRSGQSDYNPAHAAGYGKRAEAEAAELKGDRLGSARWTASALQDSADAGNTALRPFAAALAWANAHDFAAARETLDSAGYLDPQRLAEVEERYGRQISVAGLLATAADDHPGRARELEAALAATLARGGNPTASQRERATAENQARNLQLLLADAYVRSGRAAEALTILGAFGADHDAAARIRGLAAAYQGRGRVSDAILARAAERAPSLPLVRIAWAEALLVRGEPARAAEQARLAYQAGPRSAEALRLWGEALALQGRIAEAERRYAQAAERAPRWGKLQMLWADALWRLGRRDEARLRLAAAAGTALNASDKALLARMSNKARL